MWTAQGVGQAVLAMRIPQISRRNVIPKNASVARTIVNVIPHDAKDVSYRKSDVAVLITH
jgi:hypothetical protein